MLIAEVFSHPVQYNWNDTDPDEGYQEAEFTIGDNQYAITFVLHDSYDGSEDIPHFEVEFMLYKDSRGLFDVTGTGNSVAVMSTVVTIIQDFVRNIVRGNVDLSFSAKELSRRSLYAAVIRRLGLAAVTKNIHGMFIVRIRVSGV
jgi:hypothetical protein